MALREQNIYSDYEDYGYYTPPVYDTQYTTEDLIAAAQNLLNQGYDVNQIREVAGQLNLDPIQIDQVYIHSPQ
jgi:hypothetical protein